MGVNSVIVTGYVSRPPVLSTSRAGRRYLVFSLGYAEPCLDAGGARRNRYSFIDCVVFGEAAIFHYRHLRKDRKIAVRGRLHQNKLATAPERGFQLVVKDIDYGHGKQGASSGDR
jgi:single-stranded DNA-binding protein